MYVAADDESLARSKHHFAEAVREVHGVEERKAGINPRGGKYGKECSVRFVGGVLIAAGVVVAASKPRLNAFSKFWLPARFDCARARLLGQQSPCPTLQHAPAEQVERTGGSRRDHDEISAVRSDI